MAEDPQRARLMAAIRAEDDQQREEIDQARRRKEAAQEKERRLELVAQTLLERVQNWVHAKNVPQLLIRRDGEPTILPALGIKGCRPFTVLFSRTELSFSYPEHDETFTYAKRTGGVARASRPTPGWMRVRVHPKKIPAAGRMKRVLPVVLRARVDDGAVQFFIGDGPALGPVLDDEGLGEFLMKYLVPGD